ncbi:50S ribosomal protein L33 [candidate division WWE3 bacterium RIFCSPHIGHO2_01_FULL_48_15]|uniref:Large ribosomal subunit protein bL33 n=1 Tax=candidate division WWE3 bacterium RIFCSPHIGHO2_01_FULL_48_15 TaxID=1802619 RepID=A0A1F4VFL8_UNCKA|nr:MAG: 50S ribosomal protein L33 [candidate division WWE3 bacterium RIFCSPHIGHO2_01_FULL_48_15]
MAKSARYFIKLKCSECGAINYTSKRKRAESGEGKLELKKFCPKERKRTLHQEVKI